MDDGGAVLDLNDFFYFVQVVDRGGFTAAGRTLRIPKSTLSHRIQQLETNIGVRLLNRTSRRFAIRYAGSARKGKWPSVVSHWQSRIDFCGDMSTSPRQSLSVLSEALVNSVG
jgi:DNA-binding transcriptional LysR family regulator